MSYWRKMLGATRGSPPRVSNEEVFWSWVGGFLGIAAVGLVGTYLLTGTNHLLMIGAFGSTAVLVYGAPRSPLAQPRNVLFGHIFSALVGVASYKLLHGVPWLADAVAVGSAIAVMHVTRTLRGRRPRDPRPGLLLRPRAGRPGRGHPDRRRPAGE